MDKKKKMEANNSEEEKEALMCKDILEEFLSHVPLIDLVSASRVSRAWKRAVSSSLRHVSPPKPWLIVHAQSSRPPYSVTAHAYDPRSGAWFLIRRRDSPIDFRHSDLLSSNSAVLFALSPTSLAFSSDALRLRWTHTSSPPKISRKNPIIAKVGRRVVVFGGACEFGADPVEIEVYDAETSAWSACNIVPEFLDDSFSVAILEGEMFLAGESTGLVYAFDPEVMTWRGPYDLRRGVLGAFCTVAEFCGGGGMVAAELIGSPECVRTVRLTKFRGDRLEIAEDLGEMPNEILESLKGESSHVSCVAIAARGNFVFMINPSDPRAVIECEMGDGGCRWTSVPNRAVDGASWIMQRLVIGCADVAVEDLRSAIVTDGVTFVADSSQGLGV